jgi:hypothetical protein
VRRTRAEHTDTTSDARYERDHPRSRHKVLPWWTLRHRVIFAACFAPRTNTFASSRFQNDRASLQIVRSEDVAIWCTDLHTPVALTTQASRRCTDSTSRSPGGRRTRPKAATFVEQSVAWPVRNRSGRTFYCLPGLPLQTGVVKTQVAECERVSRGGRWSFGRQNANSEQERGRHRAGLRSPSAGLRQRFGRQLASRAQGHCSPSLARSTAPSLPSRTPVGSTTCMFRCSERNSFSSPK